MIKWLLTTLIVANLSIASIPRCGMLRHVIMSLLPTEAVETLDKIPQLSCHEDAAEETESSEMASIGNTLYCPCELAKFSYAWTLLDLSPKISGAALLAEMEDSQTELIRASTFFGGLDPPPPRPSRT